jgi:dolichol-phosphate mannosyltransferase
LDFMEADNKKNLRIVIPLANESETILKFHQELSRNIAQFQNILKIRIFYVVDNVSKDNTRGIIESLEKEDEKVRLVWAPQNRCVVDAYLNGFRTAINDKADYILEMDGGYTHLPEEVPLFINKLLEGYECVFGSRFTKNAGMNTGIKRRFYSRGGTIFANLLLGTYYSDATSGFEAFTAAALKKIISRDMIATGHFFQTEIRFRAKRMKYAEVPINYTNAVKHVPFRSVRNAIWGLMLCFYEKLKGTNHE